MDEVSKLMDLMVRKGCQPNIVYLNAMVNRYCKSKNLDRAFIVFREMSSRGVKPEVTYQYSNRWAV